MSFLVKLLEISFGLLLLVVITLLGLISTNSGSRWVIEQALAASNQNIVVANIEGSLIGTIQVDSVIYRPGDDDGSILKFNNLSINWNRFSLFEKQLGFDSLSVEKLTIDVPPSEKSFSMPEFSLPFGLIADQIIIRELIVERPESSKIIQNVRAKGELRGNVLTLQNYSLQFNEFSLDGQGDIAFANPFAFDADISLAHTGVDSGIRVEVKGGLNDYQFIGWAEYHQAGLSRLESSFSGRGTLTGLSFTSVSAKGLGDISGTGAVRWKESLWAEFNLIGVGIDSGLLSKQTPGKIDFQSKLSLQQQSFDIHFTGQGQLREHPLDFKLGLSGNEQRIEIREGWLQTGSNRLVLNGVVPIAGKGSLDISLQDDTGKLFKFRIESQPEGDPWHFLIQDTQLESKYWPRLLQVKPASVVIKTTGANTSINLSPYCLKGVVESVCLSGELTGEDMLATLILKSIPVARFRSWIDVSEGSGEHLHGSVSIGRSKQQWKLNSDLKLNENNEIQLDATLEQATRVLNGKIRAKLDQLEWLSLLSEQFSHTQGRFSADLDLLGPLEQPDISGPIRLVDAGMNLPGTGASLKNISLTAYIENYRQAELKGEMTSGEGRLELSGRASWWPADKQSLSLEIQGTNFTVAKLPEVFAVASPKLTLSIDEKRVRIEGGIALPILAITLDSFPEQAVTVSSDARIVGKAVDPEGDAALLPIYTDVEVQLGEQVSFSGLGLDVKLAGALSIQDSPGRTLRANGKIAVEEGRYTAYGQNLTLQQSYFVFNGPVSQPGLDLKAQRKIKDTTVGLLVRGTLQSPETEIFSKPAISDSDAIAYLLTGQPLSAADRKDGNLMFSALTQLGVKGSAGLVENIRNSTGLSTFEIDAGDDLSETALKIGKYLTPQLYVQYAKRVFTDSNSIKARYDINEKLYIETESGTDSSFDVKYRIER